MGLGVRALGSFQGQLQVTLTTRPGLGTLPHELDPAVFPEGGVSALSPWPPVPVVGCEPGRAVRLGLDLLGGLVRWKEPATRAQVC